MSTTSITLALSKTTTTTTTHAVAHLRHWQHRRQCAGSSWVWWCQTAGREAGSPCCPASPCPPSPPCPSASPFDPPVATSRSSLAMAASPCRPLGKRHVCALTVAILTRSHCITTFPLDVTLMVDRVLKLNYISVYHALVHCTIYPGLHALIHCTIYPGHHALVHCTIYPHSLHHLPGAHTLVHCRSLPCSPCTCLLHHLP